MREGGGAAEATKPPSAPLAAAPMRPTRCIGEVRWHLGLDNGEAEYVANVDTARDPVLERGHGGSACRRACVCIQCDACRPTRVAGPLHLPWALATRDCSSLDWIGLGELMGGSYLSESHGPAVTSNAQELSHTITTISMRQNLSSGFFFGLKDHYAGVRKSQDPWARPT